MMLPAAAILLSYLLGSVPTSILVARWRGIDIRSSGSGNPGSTNVVRVLGWPAGLSVLAADVGKGFAAVWLASRLPWEGGALDVEAVRLLAGLSVIIGHVWPVLAGFRGGKGVATTAGALLAVHAPAALACVAVFAILVVSFRFVSVGSMGAAVFLPIFLLAAGLTSESQVDPSRVGFGVVVAGLILLTHRPNLARLKRGEEKTLGEGPRPGRKR